MTSKLKTDVLETGSGSGTITLNNQLSGMTSASVPLLDHTKMPAGSVLNVYYHTVGNASIATTSTSFVDTGLTITLTPVSASSRFYISYSNSPHMNSVNSTAWVQHFVYRDSTRTSIGGGARFSGGGAYWRTFSQTTTGVDSPNTTSAITYKVKMNTGDATAYFHLGQHFDAGVSGTNVTFTITEIKG